MSNNTINLSATSQGNGDSDSKLVMFESAKFCNSTRHVVFDESHIPLPVKKVVDLNGMSIPKNCDTNNCENENHTTLDKDFGENSSLDVTEENREEKDVIEKRGELLLECVDSSSGAMSSEDIEYISYESEHQIGAIMALITKDLSEPYSIYTYRYFIHNWPHLCYLGVLSFRVVLSGSREHALFTCEPQELLNVLEMIRAMHKEQCVGAIVCKLDVHKSMVHRGYIAMLAVEKDFRRHRIGTKLVKRAIRAMIDDNCDEVVLETEITNKAALRLYENLGFVRDKRLFRYYLNGVDALRLKLWLR